MAKEIIPGKEYGYDRKNFEYTLEELGLHRSDLSQSKSKTDVNDGYEKTTTDRDSK